MIFNKKLAVAVSGAVLLMASQFALADSTTDIVDALVSKGVLTEEEGKLISKGAQSKAKADEKANKSRISVGSFIDNANIYGNFRLRGEYRSGEGSQAANVTADQTRKRARGKFELGVETKAGNWYSDIAFVTGSDASGRSDNFTFGSADSGTSYGSKESIYLKRAMLGWKATEWLTLEGGRMKNPLYTTPMMWDGDWSVSGLTEKVNFKYKDIEFFGNFGQWANYKIDAGYTNYSNNTVDATTKTSAILATQVGFKTPLLNDNTSGKAAVTFYSYDHPKVRGNYVPGLWNDSFKSSQYGQDHLNVIEIPAEVDYFMPQYNLGARLYGEYVINTDAEGRAYAAGAAYTDSSDDNAWLIGVVLASSKDLKSFEGNKLKAGDWSLNAWYQEVGIWATDPGLGDSDFFDSRTNMKGVVLKAQYNLEDNVAFNLSAGHGSRLNAMYGTPATIGQDLANINLKKYDLIQLDATYKF